MREGKFIFCSGIVTEKLPVLQQITPDPHQARNSVSILKMKAWKEEGDLVEGDSRGRREERKERMGLKHCNSLYKHMKLTKT